MFYVDVFFENGSKVYTYATHEEFKGGELAVVNTAGAYKLVSVPQASYKATQKKMTIKFIVAKIDTTAYEAEEQLRLAKKQELDTIIEIVRERVAKRSLREELKDDPDLLARFDAASSFLEQGAIANGT